MLRTHLEQFSARPADARVFTSNDGAPPRRRPPPAARLEARQETRLPRGSQAARRRPPRVPASGRHPLAPGRRPTAPLLVGAAGRTSRRCFAGTSHASPATSWRPDDSQRPLVSTTSADDHGTTESRSILDQGFTTPLGESGASAGESASHLGHVSGQALGQCSTIELGD